MIGKRITLMLALLVAALPVRAMYGFQPPDAYATSDWSAMQVMVDDINQDGLDDVLLTVQGYSDPLHRSKLAVFTQDPDTHKPTAPSLYPITPGDWIQAGISSIDRGDVDGDGTDDIVIGHTDGVSILNPANAFAISGLIDHREDYLQWKTARVGDIDGDGKLDIAMVVAVGDEAPARLVVYRGDGTGHFDKGREIPLPDSCCFRDLRVVDMNGDGRKDLLLYSEDMPWHFEAGTHGFWVHYNRGGGTFGSAPQLLVPGSGFSGNMAIGDVDGDGRPDLAGWYSDTAVSGYWPNTRLYLHGRMKTPYRSFRSWPSSWSNFGSPLIHDMNGDGKQDVVFTEDTGITGPDDPLGICYANYAQSGGKYVFRYRFHCPGYGDSQAAGDINGDGLVDLVNARSLQGGGFGWVLGTDSPDIVNLVVGEGLTPGTIAYTLKNASTSKAIAEPSVEVKLSVTHGAFKITDTPDECEMQYPYTDTMLCRYQDLATGASINGIVHYTMTQTTPMTQLTVTSKAMTPTEETILADNAMSKAVWIQ